MKTQQAVTFSRNRLSIQWFTSMVTCAVALVTGGTVRANTLPVSTPQSVAVTVNTPKAITLSAADAEGDALTYAIVSPPFRGTLSGVLPNLIYTPTTDFKGNDNFWFVAKDASGASAPALVAISLNPGGNIPAVVSLSSPANGATFASPATISLQAQASDSDGTVTRVEFLLGFTSLATVTNPPYTFNWAGVPAGTYALTAKAFNNTGARTFSAPVVVTVTGVAPSYNLTVVGGSGSGLYPMGAVIPIDAPNLPGKVFSSWSGGTVANSLSGSGTVFQMPAANVTLTANYVTVTPPPPNTYTLTVTGGTGSGSYAAGTTVNLTANPPPAGQAFLQWTGAAVASPTSPNTTLVMPAANASVAATYYTIAPFALTVNGGTGSGSYLPGTVVNLQANPPAAGTTFDKWIGASVLSTSSPSTTLVMPSAAATVTATYVSLPAPTPIGGITNPILFVTQIPIGMDFTTIGSVFGNHKATTDTTGRGGDLYIRYPDGSLKNLTAAAGFGTGTGFQGANSIAVRNPSVHWDGTKAVFSMVVGAPTAIYQISTSTWQLYEVTGFGIGETTVITKVPNQPTGFNNISPCYGSDGRIIFATDRPRSGQAHLYPQLDEYELSPTVSGLWSLDPATGDLIQLDHAPSGAFTPSVDSFGRVIFTRWDHLQQDQEADLDRDAIAQGLSVPFGTFNYSDESTNALVLAGDRTERFPEPRAIVGHANRHVFNFFFPWMINQDGTEEETLNHVGRQELARYLEPSFLNDSNLGYFYNTASRFNTNSADNFLHLKEDPNTPGLFYGIDAPEFSTHAAGQILTLNGPVGLDADHMRYGYVTHPETKSFTSTPTTNHSGLYREPLPMSDGTLIAVHTPNTDAESQRGTGSDYAFRLRTLKKSGAYWVANQNLTAGFTKSVSYYANGGGLVNYTGPLWELNPVEVRVRPVPVNNHTPLGAPEQQILDEESVDVSVLKSYLQSNNLALVVSRNLTTRDHADRQQPYNLRVAGTTNQTLGAGGKIYDIGFLQFFQGDQLRGFGLYNSNSLPRAGRRVLAEPLHDSAALANNPGVPASPTGSVKLGDDGSMAAFVPARRALTWQLTDTNGGPVVRERFWLTFQPGEIRTCTSCHGVNTRDQANQPGPTNKPEALRTLLQGWKAATGLGTSNAALSSIPPIARLTLRLQAQPATAYRVQSSPDLVNWTTVGTNTTDAVGEFKFQVPNTHDLSSRYYRLVP